MQIVQRTVYMEVVTSLVVPVQKLIAKPVTSFSYTKLIAQFKYMCESTLKILKAK